MDLSSEQRNNMEKKVKESLQLSQDEREIMSRMVIPGHRPSDTSFYDKFSVRGIRVDQDKPGLVVCTLTVPSRLTDRAGNLAVGAVASIVDVLGLPMNVMVDYVHLVHVNGKA